MATSSLGRLTLDLVVKLGSYVEGMNKAERTTKNTTTKMGDAVKGFKEQVVDAFSGTQIGSVIDGFNSKIGSIRRNVLVAGAAVAGMAAGGVVIGAAALAKMAIETAKADVQLQMLADRANTSVQNFQILEHAALGFGVSQDQLGSILADVQEKLGEFSATEGGGAADFFDALKNNTKMTEDQIRSFSKTLQGKDGVEAIQLLNDKMDELGVTSQERRFVFESLASDLGNLAPLFAQNGKMLDEFGEALEDAGILKMQDAMEQSRLLAAQTQALDLQFQGMKNQLVSAVMPAVSNLMSLFVDTTNSAIGLDSGVSVVSIGMNAFAGVVVTATGVLKTLFVIARESMVGLINTGMTLYNVVTAGSFSGAVDALKTGASVVKQSWSTVADTALESGKKAVDAFSGNANVQGKLTQAILKTTVASQLSNTGLKVNTKQADENAKAKAKTAKATSALAKAESDYNKILQERERIKYDYASGDDQKMLDYQKEVQRLLSAGASQEYLAVAKERYEQTKKLSDMQFAFELTEHRMTEQKKLEYSFGIKHQEILADQKLTSEQRKQKIQSLNELYKIETDKLRLSQSKQLLDVRKNWMTASDYAEQYYALVREEILNTAEYSPEMKDTLIKGANLQQGIEQNEKRESVWSDYKSMMGLDESPYQQDMNLLKAARDEMLITEEEYQRQRLEMQLSYGAQYGADFAGMMMGLVDSSSSAYTVLGLAQKSFALYSVMMDSKVAISKAWASAAFPYNMPAVGMAVMQTGLLEAAVSALSPVGFAGGGFTGFGGKYEPAGIVHKGEGVLNQEEIAALGGPAGFFALRDSIRNGFADGGLALDAPKLMNVQSPAMQDYVNQTQQNASAQLTPQHLQINNILDPNIVGDFMGTSSGTKTFMNFIKNNRTTLKAILA
ncbi:hypothetical protein [Acinetobacter chengduensis]|uniref:Phage tail tape measure protein n=1 Tax=Acinetobacter chengduensis TaxID=2420890 RepID=A0ABX9TSS9_9GAMM|nr:hypothetical protein [Acinetobacter chengduensis]RLL18012.1 hypothetical protein D9K81_16305 [Acinetobacter chengduensis]